MNEVNIIEGLDVMPRPGAIVVATDDKGKRRTYMLLYIAGYQAYALAALWCGLVRQPRSHVKRHLGQENTRPHEDRVALEEWETLTSGLTDVQWTDEATITVRSK